MDDFGADRATMAEQSRDNPPAQVTTLGGVLRAEREHRLLAVDHMARFAGVEVDTIRAVEGDDHALSPAELDELMHHYQAPDWSTQRGLGELTLDLNAGIVSFSNQESSHLIDDAADRVLARYVLLLYGYRGVGVGTKIPVKDIDLMVLRAALSVRKPEVEQQIQNLLSQQGANAAARERRAGFVLGGLAVVAIALGVAIVLTGSEVEPRAVVPNETLVPAAEATVEIGEAVSIVRPPNDQAVVPGE